MNKIVSVIIVGLFAANANAFSLTKASDAAKPSAKPVAAKVETAKQVPAPAKKVSLLKKTIVKAQATTPAAK